MVDPIVLWEKIIKILKYQIDEVEFNTYIKPLNVHEYKDNTLYVWVESTFMKEKVEQRYKLNMMEIINDILMMEASQRINVIFELKQIVEEKFENYISVMDNQKKLINNLNQRYRFENFVVGKGNELANAACSNITKSGNSV